VADREETSVASKVTEHGIEQVPKEPAERKESIEEFLCFGDDE